MKNVIAILILFSTSSLFADGICTNDKSHPGSQQSCQSQGQGPWGGKSMCQSTTGCRWISLSTNGVCRNDKYSPASGPVCQMQGQNGGQSICQSTPGCEWIYLY